MAATLSNLPFEHFSGDNENICFARLQNFQISLWRWRQTATVSKHCVVLFVPDCTPVASRLALTLKTTQFHNAKIFFNLIPGKINTFSQSYYCSQLPLIYTRTWHLISFCVTAERANRFQKTSFAFNVLPRAHYAKKYLDWSHHDAATAGTNLHTSHVGEQKGSSTADTLLFKSDGCGR